MGRAGCCSKVGLRRGPWSAKEDTLLASYIQQHGQGQWRSLPKKAGLLRCGKSCRLRWMNYLRPGIKRGNISEDEEDLIVRLHRLLGNRWSLIAGRLPGRTDNEIKNYWNTHLLKKLIKTNNNNNNNKKKKKAAVSIHLQMEGGGEEEEEEMKSSTTTTSKVYSPKPIRVSSSFPRTESYDSLESGSSSSEAEAATAAVSTLPELADPTVLYHFSDFISDDVNTWEKVYAEYLQLL